MSHCAPDDPSESAPSKLTCAQLRERLKALDLNTRGNKPQLVERLEAAQKWMETTTAAAAAIEGAAAVAAAATPLVVQPNSAAGAAAAGEGVEGTPASGAAAVVRGGKRKGRGEAAGIEAAAGAAAAAAPVKKRRATAVSRRGRRSSVEQQQQEDEEERDRPGDNAVYGHDHLVLPFSAGAGDVGDDSGSKEPVDRAEDWLNQQLSGKRVIVIVNVI